MNNKELKQWQKFEALENAVLRDTPTEIEKLYKSFGEIAFTARALGIAARYRGLETVKILVENGASFYYDYSVLKRCFRDANYNFNIFEENENYSVALLDNLHLFHINNMIRMFDQYFNDPLPLNERLRILDYFFRNAEKISFKPDEFLFYAILSGEQKMIDYLKNKGVALSEKRIKLATEGKGEEGEWHNLCWDICLLKDENFIPVISALISEIGGEQKLHFTEWLWDVNRKRFIKPEFFEFLLENFNQKKMNKGRLMKMFIDLDSVSCLELCAKHDWLKLPKKRDEMIEYAAEKDKTECVAFLLDFKNRTADLGAERERAEKRAERELNADPNSLSSLKKSWSFKKKEDGTLKITGYKGKSTSIVVPAKIGEDRVTEIDEWAFSPYAPRIKEPTRKFRRTIRKIVLPDGLVRIGTSAFCELLALEEVNIPSSVKFIGEYAFRDCYRLKRIVVPEGVSEIKANAFSMLDGLGELEYVELPSTLSYFKEECRWWRVFLFHSANCPKLTVAVPNAPHAEKFCEHNKVKFVYKEGSEK